MIALLGYVDFFQAAVFFTFGFVAGIAANSGAGLNK